MECKLNELIQERGYKKKWLAEQLGVSASVFSRWCNGDSIPSLENAMRVAALMGCDVEDIWKIEKPRN